MKDYYEDLWQQLPEQLELPDFARRRDFLLSELRSGDRALDLGCGTGAFTALLAKDATHAIGIEVAENALSRARALYPELDFRLAPIDGPLPLDNNTFELVWASEVIEHVADTARWLSEVRRVLVPGGRLLVTTPNHPRLAMLIHGLGRYSDPVGDHLHLYTRRSLAALLKDFGFSLVHVGSAGGPPLMKRTLLASAMR